MSPSDRGRPRRAGEEHVAAPGCQECGGDLAGSVSADFCSERCQDSWHSRHGQPPPRDSGALDPAGSPPAGAAAPDRVEIGERTTPTLAEWFRVYSAADRSGPPHH